MGGLGGTRGGLGCPGCGGWGVGEQKRKYGGCESRGSHALGSAGVSQLFATLSQSGPINRGEVCHPHIL